jgi:hypothetical protein
MDKILLIYEEKQLREEMGKSARNWMEQHTWNRHRERMMASYERARKR